MTTIEDFELAAFLAGAQIVHGTDDPDVGDVLDGTAGVDFINGGLGDDVMSGGFGDDTYVVDSQFDVVQEGADGGIDTVISTANYYELPPNVENLILAGDSSISGAGNDLGNRIYGNSGRNTITGSGADDYLDGGSGNDFLVADTGNDHLYGGDDDPGALFVSSEGGGGLSNRDFLDGGAGNDLLDGGSGNDTLLGGDGDDQLFGGLDGTGAGGVLLTNNDSLDGGAGDDVLNGGSGFDYLYDPEGNETYVFGPGGGSDYIEDHNGNDQLLLTGGLTPADVSMARDGNDLIVTVNSTGDSVWIAGYFTDEGHIESIVFANGVSYDAAAVDNVLNGVPLNQAPVAGDDAVSMTEDGATVSGNALANDSDPEGAGLTVANPGVLHGSYGDLVLNADGSYTYALNNSLVQSLARNQTVTESFGYTVTDGNAVAPLTDDAVISVTVTGANDAPVVANAIADQDVGATAGFGFTVASTAFSDVDADALAYSAQLAGGGALPSWLGFDAATRTFSGTPPAELRGHSIELEVTASDGLAAASDVFKVSFAAPPAPLPVDPPPAGGHGRTIIGTRRDDYLVGTDYDDTIDGRQGRDTMIGGKGDDTYYVDRKPGHGRHGRSGDTVVEKPGEGYDTVIASVSYTLPANVEALRLTGKATEGHGNELDNVIVGNNRANRLYGEGGNDLVRGGKGKDQLEGGSGLDVLEGGRGDDRLHDSSGASLLNGGAGRDRLEGSSTASFYVGGRGNDRLTLGAAGDVMAFNRGDGRDKVFSDGASDATLSLGGGIRYQDLALRKSGSDLVVEVGSGERIVLDDWYRGRSNQSVKTLQVVAAAMPGFDAHGCDPLRDDKIEMFDFRAIVRAFDEARESDCRVDRWQMMNGLLDAHLAGSDGAAIGGDLAYQYGARGSLAGMGLGAAQEVLGAPMFGTAPQALQSPSELSAGPVKLG